MPDFTFIAYRTTNEHCQVTIAGDDVEDARQAAIDLLDATDHEDWAHNSTTMFLDEVDNDPDD